MLQDGPTASRPTYRLIQVLRAIAALMVVVEHTTIFAQERVRLPIVNWINGGSGVDIFFVISGFVMTLSSAPLRASSGNTAGWPSASSARATRTFLARRLERIIPLYWLLTALKIALAVAAPWTESNRIGPLWNIVASFLFLPSLNYDRDLQPVLIVGGTLNFEMMFYVFFAAAILFRLSPGKVLVPCLVGLTLLWFALGPGLPTFAGILTHSMLLEFAMGIVLALGIHHVKKLPVAAGAALAVIGFILLSTWTTPNFSHWRGFFWGLAAMALVAGAVALERRLGALVPRFLLELGDASYSIYLVHGFTIPALGLLLIHLGLHGPSAVPVVLVTVTALTVAISEGVYRLVELPITRWFKGRRRTAVPANA